MVITEHDAANFRDSASYLGAIRGDDLVYIQITANNTRIVERKKRPPGDRHYPNGCSG